MVLQKRRMRWRKAMKHSNNKTILVTGGAGYIGSTLVRMLLQKDYQVVCIDKLNFGGASLVDIWGDPNFVLHKIDITEPGDVDDVFKQHEIYAVVHLAAIVGDPACRLEPELATRTNLEASIHLLENATRFQVRNFIFASTCSNYGKMEDPNGYVDESSPLSPISLYAELKVEFESILLKQETNKSFCPTILRFATVYGISPRMRFDLTVNEFTKELALARELLVFGEQFWRPYCHVSDITQAIMKVLSSPDNKVSYNVFNVGDTSQNYTKKMLVNEIIKQIPDGQVRYVHRDEDPRDYCVCFEKIKNVLNYSITRTVPQGIREIHSSLRMGIIENPDHERYYNIPMASAI
jgi:nucleoside-diphosphate-sugar epimerase